MPDLLPPELRTALTDIAAHLKTIDARLGAVEAGLGNLRVEVAEMKGRVSQLPTIWNLAGILLAMLGLAIAGQGAVLFLLGRMLKVGG